MPMSDIAEALARLEHKVDLLLKNQKDFDPLPMHFQGVHTCPVCKSNVEYIVDAVKNIVIRRCGCRSGKLSSVIPLTPTSQGASNASSISPPSHKSSAD